MTGVRNLPAALDATVNPPVAETLPVFIFGFPGGRGDKPDNPAVTVGKGTIAGLRRDARKRLNDVHVNGEINPGNSGGPVVDAKGRLVGVAVATVVGKQIGFVIPTVQLNEMFKGSVFGTLVLQARRQGTRVNLDGEAWLFDRAGMVRDPLAIHEQIDDAQKLDLNPDEYIALARLTDPMLKVGSVVLHFAPAGRRQAGGYGPARERPGRAVPGR